MASPAATGFLLVMLLTGATLVAGGGIALIQLLRLRRLDAAERIRDGPVRLDGRATPLAAGKTVESPLTGRRALWYEFEVRPAGVAVGNRGWDPVDAGSDRVPFFLETAAGRVVVDPTGADLALDPALDATVDGSDAADVELAGETMVRDEARDTITVGDVTLSTEGRYRLVERRLVPGATVAVTGVATDADRDDATARIGGRPDAGRVRRWLEIPFVVGDAGIDRPARRLRDRALVGLLFGLPLVALSLTLLFPPPAP